eukprot:7125713-Prymnesium_polylepis.2
MFLVVRLRVMRLVERLRVQLVVRRGVMLHRVVWRLRVMRLGMGRLRMAVHFLLVRMPLPHLLDVAALRLVDEPLDLFRAAKVVRGESRAPVRFSAVREQSGLLAADAERLSRSGAGHGSRRWWDKWRGLGCLCSERSRRAVFPLVWV